MVICTISEKQIFILIEKVEWPKGQNYKIRDVCAHYTLYQVSQLTRKKMFTLAVLGPDAQIIYDVERNSKLENLEAKLLAVIAFSTSFNKNGATR